MTVCKTVRPMLSVRCLSVCLSVCDVGVLWPTVGRIKMKPGMQVGIGPGHIVLGGDPAPLLPKGHRPPIFGPYLLWQMAAWIKMPLDMELGLGPGDIVLDGDPAPASPKTVRAPNLRPMFVVSKRLDRSRWYLAWK